MLTGGVWTSATGNWKRWICTMNTHGMLLLDAHLPIPACNSGSLMAPNYNTQTENDLRIDHSSWTQTRFISNLDVPLTGSKPLCAECIDSHQCLTWSNATAPVRGHQWSRHPHRQNLSSQFTQSILFKLCYWSWPRSWRFGIKVGER